MGNTVRRKVINQLVAPISGKIVRIEKRSVLDGYRIAIMGSKDTRVYLDNIYCSENVIKDFKLKEGKKVEAGQVLLEWEDSCE